MRALKQVRPTAQEIPPVAGVEGAMA